MGEKSPKQTRAGLDDLGVRKSRLLAAVAVGAGLPAAMAWGTGATPAMIGAVAAAGTVSAGAILLAGFRYLHGTLVQPLQLMATAMDDLRTRGRAPRLVEAGAPLLHPMLRRFNQACQSIEQREQLSQANLMSVEVAFDRVHSVLQSLREGVLVVDVNGRVVLANRSARQVVHADVGPIEGRPLVDLVEGDLQQAVRTGMERISAAEAEEIRSTDIANGKRIFDLNIVQVQSTRPDHDFGKVVVLVDVTKNHEVNKLKDDLLSSISHELRTPLTNMCSSSEILTTMDPSQEADWREFVGILATESHRLKDLVDDVMLYSQIETGRTEWRRDPTDVAALVTRSMAKARPACERAGLGLTVSADGRAIATIDGERIAEVLARVLDNAVKFTPRGGSVQVQVTAHDDLIEVAIADSGPGIAPEHRQRVFERFSQIGDVMTDKPKGAGLGLAICQRIVDAMGGTMWCEDSPLGGAQFRFVLPAATPAPTAA
ncbi:MAG: PAS domain-containing protein [Planctomycetes bacterium]|nr:PAS domain-containing protein [Planctomycetota bacterium]